MNVFASVVVCSGILMLQAGKPIMRLKFLPSIYMLLSSLETESGDRELKRVSQSLTENLKTAGI